MAFFKFRKGADVSPRAPAQPQSIEAIRQRAKYRLAGATLLVLVGVIGLPMLFDKQPRPMAVDTPISIPDRNKVAPLAIPGAPATPSQIVVAPAPALNETTEKPPAPLATAPAEAPAVDTNIASKQAPDPTDKGQVATNSIEKVTPPASKPVASAAVAKPELAKSEPAKPEANRAQALLDGKEADAKAAKAEAAKTLAAKSAAADAKPAAAKAAAAEGRFVVQVGAFADNARAHEVRLKLERAGLKTYAQAAETKDGRRIRVRLGPFATRAEAEKAADKVKKLSLPASLLTL
ncbi:SPOR domain-containing protein [Rhodoferax sp. 4810]|nr:SPOR domain-containing protein [Rhodoferax jenense]